MSKQILFLLIMVLVVGCSAPRISPDTEIQTIYELPNMDKNTIYENTLLWIDLTPFLRPLVNGVFLPVESFAAL